MVDLGIPSATSRAVQNNLAIRSRDVAAYVEATWLPYYDVLRGARHAVIPCRADAAAGLATIKSSWCGGPDAVR